MSADEELQASVTALCLSYHPWQFEQASLIAKLRANNKLHHAFIFYGAGKRGKFDFACATAASLLCKNPQASGGACTQCAPCRLVQAQTHPDCYVLQPEAGKQIPVDEIRSLLSYMNKSASMGEKRVVVIDQAQRMNLASANALLKFLEEPGEHVHLFLVCDEIDALLPTIRSRCQKLLFPVLSKTEARNYLEHALAQTGAAFEPALLEYANYSVIHAQALIEDPLYQKREAVLGVLVKVMQGNMGAMLASQQLEEFALIDFLQWWLDLCGDVLKLSMGAELSQLRFQSAHSHLEKMLAAIEKHRLNQFMQSLQHDLRLLRKSAPLNQPLILEARLLEWQAIAT